MHTIKMEAADDTFLSHEIDQYPESYLLYAGSPVCGLLEYQYFHEQQLEQAYSFTEYPIQPISIL